MTSYGAETVFAGGGVPDAWTVFLLWCLPKSVALQQVCMNWVTATVMLQLSDVWPQVIPPLSKRVCTR